LFAEGKRGGGEKESIEIEPLVPLFSFAPFLPCHRNFGQCLLTSGVTEFGVTFTQNLLNKG
jgi:hypothetical protein